MSYELIIILIILNSNKFNSCDKLFNLIWTNKLIMRRIKLNPLINIKEVNRTMGFLCRGKVTRHKPKPHLVLFHADQSIVRQKITNALNKTRAMWRLQATRHDTSSKFINHRCRRVEIQSTNNSRRWIGGIEPRRSTYDLNPGRWLTVQDLKGGSQSIWWLEGLYGPWEYELWSYIYAINHCKSNCRD